MKKLSFSLLLLLICSFCIFAQSSVTKEEYIIYARVLKSIRSRDLKESKTRYSFVILNSTFKPDYFEEDENGRFKILYKSFKQRNSTSLRIESLFPTDYEYKITSQSQIDELLKIGEKRLQELDAESQRRNPGVFRGGSGSGVVWEPFHAEHPNTNGYYQFSRVGFNSNKRFALVEVRGKGAFWSSREWYKLRKTKGRWTVYSSSGNFAVQ